ncbi:MAG: fused MFS/spermidine synthase [Caldilineaceae bacterium]
MQWAATGIDSFNGGLLAGSLLAILLLFSVPITLLGTVSPWAVRLAITDVGQAGQVAGRLYAMATAGSLIGTFLPVLWLIPAYGTRWTFAVLALAPLVVITMGTWRTPRRWLPLAVLLLVLALAYWTATHRAIRAGWAEDSTGTLLYEDESLYNYIAVHQWGSERHLKLNDGIGIHSVYHPDSVLSLGIWITFCWHRWCDRAASKVHSTHRIF